MSRICLPNKVRGVLLACCVAMLAACGDGPVPPGVMSEQEMTDFLTEAYMIEGFYAIETGYHYETLTAEITGSYQELLERQHITAEKYERSRDYYMHHPDRYKRIHEEVVRRLDAM